MIFMMFLIGLVALLVLGSFAGRYLHRLEQTQYQPLIGPRHYVPGMEAPDARYDPISAVAAQRMAEQVKMIQLGIPPQPTESSIELAKAYQRAERRHANLDENTGAPLRVH